MKKNNKDDKINKKRKILMEKNFGIGIEDFKKLVTLENVFYIDKTLFIKEIIDNSNQTILITRPRRFGKTLNMSMLDYFFDINKTSKNLFKSFKIMKEENKYTSKLNSVPVISLTFNGIKPNNLTDMKKEIQEIISMTYRKHSYLLDSDKLSEEDKKDLKTIIYNNIPKNYKYSLSNQIFVLSTFLNIHFNKKVIILLDEYDAPLLESYVHGYYEEAIVFFKSFIGKTFKSNSNLEKGVLTGVSRVSKESIFSEANNIQVFTLLDNKFSSSFGFTEEDILCVLEKYGMLDRFKDIKTWYDGYTFGETKELYNPWSTLNYLETQEIGPYWVNTSSNSIIKMIFAKSSIDVKKKLEDLIQGKEVEVDIDLNTIIPNIEERENNIWGLFLQTGYLKPTKKMMYNRYKVKIPNLEIKILYEEIIKSWSPSYTNNSLKYLIEKDFKSFEEYFEALTIQMFSFLDVKINEDENFYHAFVLGMLVELKDVYTVLSNRESGLGRYDICLEPFDKTKPSFIIEFKSCKNKSFKEAIKEAKEQIINKKYETDLKQKGYKDITKMVIAFKGKEVKIKYFK